jgi:hypothetical protein
MIPTPFIGEVAASGPYRHALDMNIESAAAIVGGV